MHPFPVSSPTPVSHGTLLPTCSRLSIGYISSPYLIPPNRRSPLLCGSLFYSFPIFHSILCSLHCYFRTAIVPGLWPLTLLLRTSEIAIVSSYFDYSVPSLLYSISAPGVLKSDQSHKSHSTLFNKTQTLVALTARDIISNSIADKFSYNPPISPYHFHFIYNLGYTRLRLLVLFSTHQTIIGQRPGRIDPCRP